MVRERVFLRSLRTKLLRRLLAGTVGLAPMPIIVPLRWLTPRLALRVIPFLITRRAVALVLRVMFGTSGRPNQRDIDEYWAPTQFDEYIIACRACVHRFTWGAMNA